MTRLWILITVFVTLALATVAQAGFHMEPHVGFGLSNKWESGSTDGDLSRTNLGIKLGYQAPMGLQVGGEIQFGSGKFESGGTPSTDIKYADLAVGPYLGYQSAMGLRGYLGLFRSAVAVDDNVDSAYTGLGFKLGVGYQIVKWFALNAEYMSSTYDKFTDNTTSGDLDPKFKVNSIMLVASFPFDFGGK